MTHMDMDAAVRLVERRQEQRRRAAQEIADRAAIAEIAVDCYRSTQRRRIREAVLTWLSFAGACGILTAAWMLTSWLAGRCA